MRGREGKIFLRGHGRGSLAVTECWAVTECELCTVHKWGASPGAGVIGGYGGVTAGLRGAFFGFSVGFVQYCGGGVFLPFPEKCSKFRRGLFWAVGGNVFKISGLHFFDILNTALKIVGGRFLHFFDILNRVSKIEPAGSPCPSRVPRVRLGRY